MTLVTDRDTRSDHNYPIFKVLGVKLRHRMIWRFGYGWHASWRFSGRYETIPGSPRAISTFSNWIV